jgi:hypothetical protein
LIRTDLQYRRQANLDRASRASNPSELPWGWLARITGSSPIATTINRYLYTWVEAAFAGTAPYAPTTKTSGMSGNALCISELGNGTYVANGVTYANIPPGFAPVAIPTNTYVWIVPARAANGAEIYLIVAVQAIDGACP